jgi:hypothetical protein
VGVVSDLLRRPSLHHTGYRPKVLCCNIPARLHNVGECADKHLARKHVSRATLHGLLWAETARAQQADTKQQISVPVNNDVRSKANNKNPDNNSSRRLEQCADKWQGCCGISPPQERHE